LGCCLFLQRVIYAIIRLSIAFSAPKRKLTHSQSKLYLDESQLGVGNIIEKLSTADNSAFLQLIGKLSLSEKYIWELSKNYRYRKYAADFGPISTVPYTPLAAIICLLLWKL